MIYSTGKINVCTDFWNQSVQNWRHVTQKRYIMRHGDYDTSDRYFDKEHFETNQKSLRLPVQKLWLK